MSNLEKALSLDLSPQAREAIEKYMRQDVPHAYGSESHCLSDFRNWCVDVYEMPSLLCLRNDKRYTTADREKAIRHMNEYFAREPRNYPLEFTPYVFINEKTRYSKGVRTRYKCEKYMHEHIGDLAEHACIAKYGNVKRAILETSTWIELWNDFEDWFEEKRKRFMVKMDDQIAEIMSKKEVVTGKSRKPAPVGAVANLCKELRRTMELQGADITSIAKVEYAVCVQNGLYIPDEFLTDVAVALDVEGKI